MNDFQIDGEAGLWRCVECGWVWPLDVAPPLGMDCEHCGCRLRRVPPAADAAEPWRWPTDGVVV